MLPLRRFANELDWLLGHPFSSSIICMACGAHDQSLGHSTSVPSRSIDSSLSLVHCLLCGCCPDACSVVCSVARSVVYSVAWLLQRSLRHSLARSLRCSLCCLIGRLFAHSVTCPLLGILLALSLALLLGRYAAHPVACSAARFVDHSVARSIAGFVI